MLKSALLAPLITLASWAPAFAQCASYSSAEIAAAINNSSTASSALKSTSCTWGGAGKSESGGGTCASNGSNFGVLQLSSQNLAAAGYTPAQYLALPLQQQVDIWASQAGNSGAASGNVVSRANSNRRIGVLFRSAPEALPRKATGRIHSKARQATLLPGRIRVAGPGVVGRIRPFSL